MGNQGNNTNSEDLGVVTRDKEALKRTLGNFAMGGGDDLCLGAGYQHPFPEQVTQHLLKLAKEERAKESSHYKQLQAIRDRIDDLRAQIKVLQDKIDDLNEKKADNKDQITKNKERMAQLKTEGKENSPEYLALVAANELLSDINNDIDAEITIIEHDIDELEQEVDTLKDRLEEVSTKAEQTQEIQNALNQENGSEVVNMSVAEATTIEAKQSIKEDKGFDGEQTNRYTNLSTTENASAEIEQDTRHNIEQGNSLEALMAQANIETPQDTGVSYAKSGIKVDGIVPTFADAAAPLNVASLEIATVHTPDANVIKELDMNTVNFGKLT